MGIVAFSHAMENWWENPSVISHIMRFVNIFLWVQEIDLNVHYFYKTVKAYENI